jgi:hypothetical protein
MLVGARVFIVVAGRGTEAYMLEFGGADGLELTDGVEALGEPTRNSSRSSWPDMVTMKMNEDDYRNLV